MSDSTSLIQQIVAGANADVRINENFDAASPAMVFGRRAATTTGLTWGFYGGRWSGIAVASGTVTLGASTTTYLSILRSTGVVSASTATTNWNNTELYARSYKIVTGASTVTSYEDHRAGAFGTYTGYITASEIANTPAGTIAATNVQTAINELDTEKEAVANKATTFGTVNNTLYPTVQAVKTYADSLVLGLWDDRGSYDASVNTYPASGGSGTAGAVMKGDIWTVSVAGSLGGTAVNIGDSVRALIDTPAQTAANWAVLESNTGYVPENSANKDASGGYAGLTLFKLNLRNAANTVTSWFTTAATAARTWTLPDYDGTLATLAGTETLTNKTLTNPIYSGTTANGGTVTTIDINGGTIDGTPIGATTPAAGSFTTLQSNDTIAVMQHGTITYPTVATDKQVGLWADTSSSYGVNVYGPTHATKAGKTEIVSAAGNAVVSSTGLAVTGIVTPEADNTRTLGTGALRWSTVYAGTGTINTSDAREKTPVAALTFAEIEAAKQLSKEIGTYKFLASVQAKGDAARTHIGMTVQRAIEIMESHGLSPFAYGFICHDVWEDKFTEHVAIEAVEAVEAKAAWTEQTQWAGDRYAFRYDQLNLFIAAGIEARLTALEAA